MKDSNIAATLLKIQERKTAKGNAYAVLKLTDLNSVFELFIFSDTLQLNREILKEGSSLILTLIKSISDGENRFRRINVQKIASLKDLLNKPIEEVTFNLKSLQELSEISKFLPKLGDTLIKIKQEIDLIKTGKFDKIDNPIKNAPHTDTELASDNWTHKYSREEAAYPAKFLRANKFWPPVARVDKVYGDKNIFCTCPSMDEFKEDAA